VIRRGGHAHNRQAYLSVTTPAKVEHPRSADLKNSAVVEVRVVEADEFALARIGCPLDRFVAELV
jgi:hypothetical protein